MKHPLLLLPVLLNCWMLQGQSNPADCSNAYILCNKDAVTITALSGAGSNTSETQANGCQDQAFPETNSVWFKWTVSSDGMLEFTIMPLDEQDDIDFILYQFTELPGNCDEKKAIRCMRVGRNLGEEDSQDALCTGATGLRAGEKKASESAGCKTEAGSFLAALSTKAGESYALFINNYRSVNGFMLEFSGDCTFQKVSGPCFNSTSAALENFGDKVISVSAVYPNPALDQAQISLRSSNAFTGALVLTDVNGRVLESRTISVLTGDNTFEIPALGLHPGVYFVKIRIDDRVYLSRFYKG